MDLGRRHRPPHRQGHAGRSRRAGDLRRQHHRRRHGQDPDRPRAAADPDAARASRPMACRAAMAARLTGPVRVDGAATPPLDVGDEPLMLAQDFPDVGGPRPGRRRPAASGRGPGHRHGRRPPESLGPAQDAVADRVDGETRDDEWPFGDGKVFPRRTDARAAEGGAGPRRRGDRAARPTCRWPTRSCWSCSATCRFWSPGWSPPPSRPWGRWSASPASASRGRSSGP
jgi:hypothetical protein